MSSSNQIKRGAIISYATIILNIAIGIMYIPWMINKIGQSDFGLYSLAIALISLFTIDFGLGEAVSRYLSKYIAENQPHKIKDFLGITLKIYLVIDLFIFIALLMTLLFSKFIYVNLTTGELYKFQIVFSIAAIYSVISFPFAPLNGVLNSNERFVLQKLTDLICRLLTFATMVVVLFMGYGLYSLVIVNAIFGIISILIKLIYVNKNKLIEINFILSNNRTLLKEIFRFSIWSSIIAIAQRFIINITPTVLAAFAGSIQISLYSIAVTIEGYTWTFANALNGLFLPRVTRMISQNSNHSIEIENLMIKVGRLQFILIGLLFIGFLTTGKEFMRIWMGDRFQDAYYVSLLLIAPCIITLTQQIGDTALVAVNKIKYRAYCSLTVAGISIILSLFFSQFWGAIGAGVAILIGNVIGLIIGMNIVYYKVLGVNVFRFFKECHLKMCVPLFLFCGIGYYVQYILPVDNLIKFAFKFCLLIIIYFLLVWSLVLNSFEKDLYKGAVRRMLHMVGRKIDA